MSVKIMSIHECMKSVDRPVGIYAKLIKSDDL